MNLLYEMTIFVYYEYRKSYGILKSIKEMLISPILHLLEGISLDYPNNKRWHVNIR